MLNMKVISFLHSPSQINIIGKISFRCQRSLLHRSFTTTTGQHNDALTGSSNSHLQKNKKKILFLGTPFVAAKSLELLHKASQQEDSPFQITAVISQPPALAGRLKKLTKSPVQEYAEFHNLTIFTPTTAKDIPFLTTLEAQQPSIDLCITAAYGNYLPKRFLAIPKYGTINIHPSLLPKYRGAAPVQRCLEQGDNVTGVSLLYTVTKMDAGPILHQSSFPLTGNEKAMELLNELFEIGTNQLITLLPKVFSEEITIHQQVTLQDETQVTHAPKIETNESLIQFDKSTAKQIYNKWRAFDHWPGIYSYFHCFNELTKEESIVRMKLITICLIDDAHYPFTQASQDNSASSSRSSSSNGQNEKCQVELAKHHKNPKENILIVTCYDGSRFGILDLQPESKKIMPIKAFANGFKGKFTVKWISSEEMRQRNLLSD